MSLWLLVQSLSGGAEGRRHRARLAALAEGLAEEAAAAEAVAGVVEEEEEAGAALLLLLLLLLRGRGTARKG